MGYDLSTLRTYMEVGSIGAIKSLVEANLGYTIISKAAVRLEANAGSLKIIPIRDVRIMREFNFVFLDDRPREFTDDFMSFLLNPTTL
jgi:DNA-binding transcriptional LysR family regulator